MHSPSLQLTIKFLSINFEISVAKPEISLIFQLKSFFQAGIKFLSNVKDALHAVLKSKFVTALSLQVHRHVV